MEKWFGVVLFLLSSYELVFGQCFLSIGLVEFQNLYNLEIRDNTVGSQVCCCDDTYKCKNDVNQFSLDTCESYCDPFFILYFLECQDLAPCPLQMITGTVKNSNTTTTVNYEFHLTVNSSAIEQVSFQIVIWEDDEDNSANDVIDIFDITINFPSDNQPKVFTGSAGIASITLTYDIICIEPDACNTTVASSELIGTNKPSTSSGVHVITVIQAITVTETAILSTVVTATNTACVGSSPESTTSPSDSTLPVWVSLSVFFFVLAAAAVTLAIVMACILNKKSKYTSFSNPCSTAVQFRSVGKQTNATGESDTGGINCSGNVSYARVNMNSNGFENEDDRNEDNYECLYKMHN